MKKQLTLIIFLTFSLQAFGQHNVGVKINGGVSKISNSLNSPNLTVQLAPSGYGGLFYNLNLGDRSIIGAELLFMRIGGKDEFTIKYFDINGNIVGQGTETIYKNISYLALPIYYGFKFNRFAINLGIQSSLVISSSSRVKGEATSNGGATSWDEKLGELNINSYDFGPRAGIIFNLTDKLAIEGKYYYGVHNILNNNEQNLSWKVQQGVIGVRYNFLVVKKSKNE